MDATLRSFLEIFPFVKGQGTHEEGMPHLIGDPARLLSGGNLGRKAMTDKRPPIFEL